MPARTRIISILVHGFPAETSGLYGGISRQKGSAQGPDSWKELVAQAAAETVREHPGWAPPKSIAMRVGFFLPEGKASSACLDRLLLPVIQAIIASGIVAAGCHIERLYAQKCEADALRFFTGAEIEIERIQPARGTGSGPARQAAEILDEAARAAGVPVSMIRGARRDKLLCAARRAAARSLREAGYSWRAIGCLLGGRHYSTIMRIAG